MNTTEHAHHPDTTVITLTMSALAAVTLLLYYEFNLRQAVLFLTGAGFGISLFHASFGFTGSWRQMIRLRRSAGIRAQLLLFALCSILFFPLVANVFPAIKAGAALGPVSVSVLVGAFMFGIGMQLGGGCGSGTLLSVGGGYVRMLITLAFFIAGAFVATAHLDWWLALPNIGKVSLIEKLGWIPALLLQLAVFLCLYFIVRAIERTRHGDMVSLDSRSPKSMVQRTITGPWPLWWGVLGLVFFGMLTLMIAGHPWSITFAFGLWAAKIWTALGGDVSTWAYWSSGYPARALASSVLADVTSIMDFGLILGAVLAAGLAGRFAPESKLPLNSLLTAVIGGLLLGYGARLAFGCNIGALLAGITTGSVHGWLWLVAGFVGNIVGVYMRIGMKLDRPLEKAA